MTPENHTVGNSTAQARGSRVPPKDFLLLHATLFLYAVASVFAKVAGRNLAIRDLSPTLIFLVLETLTLGGYAMLWQQTLKRMPLTFAYSNKAVCTLWTCLFGLIFFGESLTLGKALGIIVVLAGVWLVVSEHE
jgi:multidrug transporter EmrE-like cation transporter